MSRAQDPLSTQGWIHRMYFSVVPKVSGTQKGGHAGRENFQNVSCSMFTITLHMMTCAKEAWCQGRMTR